MPSWHVQGQLYLDIYYTEGMFLKLGSVRFEELMVMDILGCGAM
jgi:hypothetical protein